MLLINDAIAATGGTPPQGDGMMSMIMIGAVFVLFYFMLIRPQNKRSKEHQELLSKLKKGDAIIAYEEKNGWYRIGDSEWVIKTLVKI